MIIKDLPDKKIEDYQNFDCNIDEILSLDL